MIKLYCFMKFKKSILLIYKQKTVINSKSNFVF